MREYEEYDESKGADWYVNGGEPVPPELPWYKEATYSVIANVLLCGGVLYDSLKRFFKE